MGCGARRLWRRARRGSRSIRALQSALCRDTFNGHGLAGQGPALNGLGTVARHLRSIGWKRPIGAAHESSKMTRSGSKRRVWCIADIATLKLDFQADGEIDVCDEPKFARPAKHAHLRDGGVRLNAKRTKTWYWPR